MLLSDLLNSVISGSTANVKLNATDALASVIDDTGAYPVLRVTLGGGSGTVTFPGNVIILNDLTVSGNTYENDQYISSEYFIGPKDQNGSWRFYISGDNLVFERRIGGDWINKGQFTGS